MLKTSFQLPDGWLRSLGYSGDRRFVALYWEPCGDEACYFDGVSYACGLSDDWLYLSFIRQPHVRHWIDENRLELGNSDESARHMLIVDASTGELFATERQAAVAIVRAQQLPRDSSD